MWKYNPHILRREKGVGFGWRRCVLACGNRVTYAYKAKDKKKNRTTYDIIV